MSSLRRAASFVLSGLLVVALAAPAGAFLPIPIVAPPEFSVPPQWRTAERSAVMELADSRGSRMELSAFMRMQARALAEQADLPDPDFVFPFRGGDLDGDGGNDLITFEWRGDSARLVARSGSDGSELWAAPGVSFGFPTDLDGDGATEVLTVAYEWTPLAAGVRSLVQSVSLRDGSDGSEIWTLRLEGGDSRNWTDLGGLGHDLQFVSSLLVMPDATGDGLPDVWVGTTTGVFLDAPEAGIITEADVFVGRTVDGANGLELGRVLAAGVDSFPWAVPAGDLSGDGSADAFTISGRSWDTGVLSAVTALGTPLWARPVPSGQAFASVSDLNGDGTPDVAVQTFHEGGPSRIAYDGRTGDELWSHPDVGYIDFAGDIDGDGGTDMIQVDTYETGAVLRAWSGATGEAIWGPVSYPAPEGAWVMFCVCTDDVTGDGIWDPLTASVVFTGEGADVVVQMSDGTDGSALWTVVLEPGESLPIPIGADADGDSIPDVGYTGPGGIMVKRGFDLEPLWSAPPQPGRVLLGFYGDDLDGDGLAEAVAAQIAFVDEWMVGSAAAYGPNELRWSTS